MIHRRLQSAAVRNLGQFPAVALLGPRQCGKTTLARQLAAAHEAAGGRALLLDLERP